MGKWQSVKLKDVLKHRKGSIVINDITEYKLCRVQLHRRGVLLREKQFGRQIKTKKQQLCRAGDLIVAEMDAKFGGYGFVPPELEGAIVSSHYYLYELDKTKISQDYFQTLISTDYIQNQIEAKGSTNYSSIRAWEFLDYEIPLPTIDKQHHVSSRFLTFSSFKNGLNSVHDNQFQYLSQLRQSILQEAIEGKLTARWRKSHPVKKGDPNTDAAALLEQIKAEKQKLIAAGKLKKEKLQDSVTNRELTLPNSWEYPFLGEITKQITDGTHQTPTYVNHGKIFLSAQNVKPFRFIPENHRYVSEKSFIDYRKNRVPEKGDLLIARVGAGIGETAVLDQEIEFAFYVSLGLAKTFKRFTHPSFLAIVCNSPYGVQYAKGNVSSGGTSAGNYNLGRIRSFKVPFPPLAEQQAIVERVDQLLSMVDDLQQQVKDRQTQAEQLMQSVLREAFEKKLK